MMKNKSMVYLLVFVFVLVSGFAGYFIGSFEKDSNEPYRYQMISVNENNIILFDQQTGDYWRKFVPSNAGPSEWEKEKSPITP